MPGILGTLLTVLFVMGWAVLAARSLWRNRKSHCGGNCAGCSGCPSDRREK